MQSTKYRISETVSRSVMGDLSGIVLYSEYSGRTAFLRGVGNLFLQAGEIDLCKLLFSESELGDALNTNLSQANKIKQWLLEYGFIEKTEN
ncbi:hypothetical protein [uncultured Paraglaciecola sp.]|uniref:hypothetical protein n=1 Tax=uncultured Paraglaciecola sp. TaxID=1765024 RepID=UPI0026371AD5|nr:hypothetical protein [uncultured Paraglaciecola sp.]